MSKTIGEKLIEIRDKHGLTQDDMASMTGVKRTTYISYETDKTSPDFDFLKKIENLFDARFDDISLLSGNKRVLRLNSNPVVYNTGRHDEKPRINEDEILLLEYFHSMNAEQQEEFLEKVKNDYIDRCFGDFNDEYYNNF